MKILIAHNAYQHRGGEDVVVDAEIALLRERGHEVLTYRRHNDELLTSPATALASAIWSRRTATEVQQVCSEIKPDIIHVHNTFPLISPSLYWIATRNRIPVVQTLHNFRLLCPQAMFLREGRVCEDCIGKSPWRAVAHKCYHDSAAQSAVLSGMLVAHNALGTFRQKVTRYIVLSEFCRDKFIQGGLPAERLRVKPNFATWRDRPAAGAREGGLYVGRLAPEKGIETLIRACAYGHMKNNGNSSNSGNSGNPRLRIAGLGPLESQVSGAFGANYLGLLTQQQIAAEMASAEYVVVPSIAYETFGMVVVEAFASATPVIATRHGSLAELVRHGVTGLLVEPGNPEALADAMQWAHAHPQQMRAMGEAARIEYERLYTPDQNYRMLMNIYEDAIIAPQESRHAAFA